MSSNVVYPDPSAWTKGPMKPFRFRTKEERELVNALYDRQKENWLEDWGPGTLNDIVLASFWHAAMVDGYRIMKEIRKGQSQSEPIFFRRKNVA